MSSLNSNKPGNKPALGKGLASLLPNAGQSAVKASIIEEMAAIGKPQALPPLTTAPGSDVAGQERIPGVALLDIDQIVPNQYQPRRDFHDDTLRELADSIKANGIIQPLIVRRGEDGKVYLIAGERRLRASKLAGLKHVPVVMRKTSDKEALELALIENIQREDLNCVDVALSYYQLIEDFHLSQEDVAKRVGKDRASVSNHLRILKLPESILLDMREGKLSFGHGRAILAIIDPVQRMQIRNKIVESGLSVRETEKLVAEILLNQNQQKEAKEPKELLPELKSFSDRLGRVLGTKVRTKGDQYRGSIMIDYFSKDDLQRISEQLLR